MRRAVILFLAGLLSCGGGASAMAQASKKLNEATRRMESPEQKMRHADDIMRQQDRMSSRRKVVDRRKNPAARPGLKKMVLPPKR